MKRILVSKPQTLLMKQMSPVMAATAVLGLCFAFGIFSLVDAWVRLPMIGTAALALAYKRTW